MYQSRSPQLMIFDSCSVHVSKMLDAHALARYHIVGIPNFKELKGLMSKVGQSSGSSSSASKTSQPSKDWKSKDTYVSTILPIKLHIATSPNLLPVVLTFVFQEEAKGSINVDALLDTGCLAGDFVARRIVDRFNIKPDINSTAKLSVCSGLDSTCYDISKSVIISVNYLNERMN